MKEVLLSMSVVLYRAPATSLHRGLLGVKRHVSGFYISLTYLIPYTMEKWHPSMLV